MTVHDETRERLMRSFDRPIMLNTVRSAYVEAQVGVLLGNAWKHVGEWDGWDYESAGVRLEVKASAARQAWEQKAPSRCSFDIKPRTGYWVGARFVERAGRNAHIYVLAWHDRTDDEADQRDERQWSYYVVLTTGLTTGFPLAQTIGLAGLDKLVADEYAWRVGAAELRSRVDSAATRVVVEDSGPNLEPNDGRAVP